MTEAQTRSTLANVALHVALIDVACTAPVVAVWLWFGVMEPLAATLLSLVRVAAWVLHLRAMLAPTQRWLDDPSDTAALAKADDGLRRLARRYGVGFVIGWLVMFAGAVAAELATGRVPPTAELLTSVVVLLAYLIGAPVSIAAVFTDRLSELRMRIGVAMSEHGLTSRPTRSSLRGRAAIKNLSLVMSTVIALGGFAGMLRISMLRDAAAEQQRHQAELDALRIDAGLDAGLDAGRDTDAGRAPPRVVDSDALPELVREAIAEGRPLSGFDPARGLVIGAAVLDDGRFVVHEAAPDEQFSWLIGGLLLLSLASAIPAATSGYSYGGSLAAPLEQLDEAARTFVEGGRLREFTLIAAIDDDEIGRLTRNFNAMFGMLEELAHAAEAVARGDLGVELTREGDLHDAFRGMLERLHQVVARMRETTLELASAATEIQASTRQQGDIARQQATTVLEVSETVATLAISAQDIADTARGALEDAEQALVTTDAMAERIGELRGETAGIGELLVAIAAIAKRSDLLALNGSLEATRAGEAGRGFSLVAAEMRRLAERVSATVDDVGNKLAAVEASGVGTVMATEDSRKLAQRAAEAARAISRVTQSQSAGTDTVSHGVLAVADMANEVLLAVSATRAAAEGLRSHAAELERLTGGFELGDASARSRERNPGG